MCKQEPTTSIGNILQDRGKTPSRQDWSTENVISAPCTNHLLSSMSPFAQALAMDYIGTDFHASAAATPSCLADASEELSARCPQLFSEAYYRCQHDLTDSNLSDHSQSLPFHGFPQAGKWILDLLPSSGLDAGHFTATFPHSAILTTKVCACPSRLCQSRISSDPMCLGATSLVMSHLDNFDVCKAVARLFPVGLDTNRRSSLTCVILNGWSTSISLVCPQHLDGAISDLTPTVKQNQLHHQPSAST